LKVKALYEFLQKEMEKGHAKYDVCLLDEDTLEEGGPKVAVPTIFRGVAQHDYDGDIVLLWT
jgi:hypothetical protein